MAMKHLASATHRRALANPSSSILHTTASTQQTHCLRRLGYPANTHRTFTTSTRRLDQQQQRHRKESFSSRLRAALGKTKVTWYPIPVALGAGVLGVLQFTKMRKREEERRIREQEDAEGNREQETGTPKKRPRTRPSGPWQVQVMSTLPLKAMSRLWGKFNELTIPYYLRVPGFKLYGWVFGVNFDEVSEPDLHVYPNLASFFYRTLKPGSRPLDPNPNAVLSPADGHVVQFGTIESGGELEQVKGVTYSLESLLGSSSPSPASSRPQTPGETSSNLASSPLSGQSRDGSNVDTSTSGDSSHIRSDEEFASVNGISYTLPNLFSGGPESTSPSAPSSTAPNLQTADQSTPSHPASESAVSTSLSKPWYSALSPTTTTTTNPTTLYYIVVYLAPGDYHRIHSPVPWIVTSRRHFAGELYSVSPYLVRSLPGLFTLNERVVLLGRWRHGFFSATPVGATNVGSIVINFDKELRTNSLTTDTAADRAAELAQRRGEAYPGYAEANYEGASGILGGHALDRGEEMGGFKLGSTVVLVFEAPKGVRRSSLDEGLGESGEARKGAWKWKVGKGEKVKVGQALGFVDVEGKEDQ